jgi:DNA-binding MarR family transcriptional regulator
LPYLVNRVGVHMVRIFTPELRRFGIGLGMWRVLAALWQAPGTRLIDLAALTCIEVSTLSRTVSALRRRGLVTRTRQGSDARAVRIALSPRGRALTARLIPLALEREAQMAAGLSPGELAELKRLLTRVHGTLAGTPSATHLRAAGD